MFETIIYVKRRKALKEKSGIYFIPELIDLWCEQNKFNDLINWDKVDSYWNFGGIHNDEDFVMTTEGAVLLGKPNPKTVAEVGVLRG